MAARALGRLRPDSSALFVCDVQEKFRPLIAGFPVVIDTARRMVQAANALDIPVMVTEQYPKALGSTVSEVAGVLPASCPVIAKTLFSMCTPDVDAWLKSKPDVRQVMLLGIEAHVCVFQTSLDLLERGYEVHLLVDGISSSRPHHRAAGLQRMAQAGALISNSEMAMFQLAADSKHPRFKEISALVKEGQSTEPFQFTSAL
ncbi:hypothetical protein VOLCADRAFT_78239 [Volvox carteri f. nagariensis]|uniref:Isochorismatase-like domain-containing protein n=1 Tax=Volvox carteri f. nagariensis TaxID=3068 RepID=D8UKC4_VOLCA|nr:uncharacterized protein VOLCADRAFT_78239 [Volvox carteri f. nagariensis]EFJ39840.1 hypothetical protein VOLCADRAFT_78239 [Volvox carteri f. nagariensis]|eukprot:XP_002959112.1 hypothetical protein VOLCADRAFT_78239 [Volvox carteri f. nagariensis]